MSDQQPSELDKIIKTIKFWVNVLLVVWLAGSIGSRLKSTLWIIWAVVYMYLLKGYVTQVKDAKAGHYHIPTSISDTGYIWVFNSDPAVGGGMWLVVSAILILIACAFGYTLGGRRLAMGNFWFWVPIALFPVWIYETGMTRVYPGGAAAYVNEHYPEVCDPQNKHCYWLPPTHIPPF